LETKSYAYPSSGHRKDGYHQPMDQRVTTTTRGGLSGLLDELHAIHAARETAVLGIVVATAGSTYQKVGALVLLDRNGLRHGVISGGCLEPELEHRAQIVFENGRALQIDFDTRSDDDLVFGSGTGCRGHVHLLLLPQPPDAPLTRALESSIETGIAFRMTFALIGNETGAGYATSSNSDEKIVHWGIDGAAASAQPTQIDIELTITPPPRLLLLGAGPETPPLLEIANRFGWRIRVAEHRGRWSRFARSDGTEHLLELTPTAAAMHFKDEKIDAAVVMSHNFAIDLQHLRFCIQSDIGYIGLLGPPARRDALLAELGVEASMLGQRLHAPVGIDLGGFGPEAIALAIAAQLQQHFSHERHA
jgi:xanthine dehydrogenase accessory factor